MFLTARVVVVVTELMVISGKVLAAVLAASSGRFQNRRSGGGDGRGIVCNVGGSVRRISDREKLSQPLTPTRYVPF